MFDLASAISDYENGALGFEETVNLFQHLIDTGLAWSLQGSYGRTAVDLIREGYCTHASGAREVAYD